MTAKKWLRTMVYGAMLSALGFTAYAQNTEPVKVGIIQSEVVTPSQRPLARSEVVARNMPYNSDAYMVWEKKDGDFLKLRLQTLPMTLGPLSGGAAIQHVNTGKTVDEIGGVARAQGTVEDINAKLDVRYFPKNKVADWYGIVGKDHVYTDFLGSYDFAKKNFMLRPGIEYKINDHISAGIEAKILGKSDVKTDNYKLGMDYLGARVKYCP